MVEKNLTHESPGVSAGSLVAKQEDAHEREALRVLIVEDDPEDIKRTLAELRQAGFEPIWKRATSIAEFEALFNPGLDVVLSAYTLADIDPLQILKIVRSSESGVPLIIISGVIGDERAADCLVLGATDYVLKDRPARLGSAVHRAIEVRKANVAKKEAERAAWRAELVASERERDIDRLRERNEFKSNFLNMVAHDLGNVVTPMRLRLRELRVAAEAGDIPQHAQRVAMIDRGMDRLVAFTTDLLDAARLQSGKLAIHPVDVDLTALAASAVDLMQPVAADGSISLAADLAPGVVIAADAGRVDQVLSNLLYNATKFTPAGGRITVVLRPSEHGAQLSVIDSGIGLDQSEVPRLFLPFSKLGHVPKGKPAGTGLGLFLSRGIIEAHGGKIWAESPGAGQGATFQVWLPLAGPSGGPAKGQPENVAAA